MRQAHQPDTRPAIVFLYSAVNRIRKLLPQSGIPSAGHRCCQPYGMAKKGLCRAGLVVPVLQIDLPVEDPMDISAVDNDADHADGVRNQRNAKRVRR